MARAMLYVLSVDGGAMTKARVLQNAQQTLEYERDNCMCSYSPEYLALSIEMYKALRDVVRLGKPHNKARVALAKFENTFA